MTRMPTRAEYLARIALVHDTALARLQETMDAGELDGRDYYGALDEALFYYLSEVSRQYVAIANTEAPEA